MSAYQQAPAAQGCACSADISQIEVGGTIVGIAGLQGIFGAFHRAGRAPDPSLANDLLAMVKVYNYVAPNSADEYQDGLLREYTRYWNARLPRDDSSVSSSLTTGLAAPEVGGPIARITSIVRRLLKHTTAVSDMRR